MDKYFYLEESPYYKGHFVISLNHKKLPLYSTAGSYNILCARLVGLNYADYLRYCRDILGAEIKGKNQKYPIAYFNSTKEVKDFIGILNNKVKKLILKI